jgi:hypothetical protein
VPNGKLGDGWLSDLRIHDVAPFEDEELDDALRKIVALGGEHDAERLIEAATSWTHEPYYQVLLRPETKDELRPQLLALLESPRRDRTARGWET